MNKLGYTYHMQIRKPDGTFQPIECDNIGKDGECAGHVPVNRKHGDVTCDKYNEPVLPNEDDRCSLCGAEITPSHDELVARALAQNGFVITTDGDDVKIEPSNLRLQQIKIHTVKKGMYKADPRIVPEPLKDDNIFWRDLPPEVTAITESGEEIPVYLSNVENQVLWNHEVKDPENE
jgi:hypothetical protein